MNRSDWLIEKRREIEEKYDTIWSPLYGERWGLYPNITHQQFIQAFLTLLPGPGTLLDAACGAGRYMPMLLQKGHTVFGIDQSQGMLARARAKFPSVQLKKIGLQEMSYDQAFDGAICMDAMEHVFPEDWTRILGNFYRALKPQGYLYFTAETADAGDIEKAFAEGRQSGLPIVYGEMEDHGVYHYYPKLEQVREWIAQARFALVEEGEGDGYHHFVIRKQPSDAAPPVTGQTNAA